jgi:hypothetical protein
MPLVYYDIVRGRSRDQVRALLDSAQAAMLEAFETPERDRYQLVTEHSPDEMIIQDNGLGIERSENIVVIHLISRRGRKTRSQKEKLYELLARNLKRDCALDPARASHATATTTAMRSPASRTGQPDEPRAGTARSTSPVTKRSRSAAAAVPR